MIMNFVVDRDGFRITRPSKPQVNTSVNYIKCHFDVDKTLWGNYDVLVAVFKSATYNKRCEVILDANNDCFIDPEVYKRGGHIQVKLFGDLYSDSEILSTTHITDVISFYVAENLIVPTEVPSKYTALMAELDRLLKYIDIAQTDLVTPEVFGAKGDGVTDDTMPIIEALTTSGTVLFTKTYKCDSIILAEGATMLFTKDAGIVSDPANTYTFTFYNASGIRVIGGNFSKYTEELDDGYHVMIGTEGTSGVFKFNDCDNVSFTDCNFDGCSCGDMIYFLNSRQIEISNCRFNRSVRDCVMLKGACKNVLVQNCRFTNLYRSKLEPYSYGVASGEPSHPSYDYSAELIENYVVDNCYFYNCAWEGADCHGGKNVRFSNNEFHDCYRFFACFCEAYSFSGPEALPRNAYIVNNYCHNDEDYSPELPDGQIHRAILFSGVGYNTNYWTNFVVENLEVVNPSYISDYYGAIGMSYGIKGLKIRNLILRATKDYGTIQDPIAFNGISGLDVKGITVECLKPATGYGVVKFYGCTGDASNITYHSSSQHFPDGVGEPSYICRLGGLNYIKLSNLLGKTNTGKLIYQYDHNCAMLGDPQYSGDIPSGRYYLNYYLRPLTATNPIPFDSDGTNMITISSADVTYKYLAEGVAIFALVDNVEQYFIVEKLFPKAALLSKPAPSGIEFYTKAAYIQ